jgi:plastocyanin domain-containing protein
MMKLENCSYSLGGGYDLAGGAEKNKGRKVISINVQVSIDDNDEAVKLAKNFHSDLLDVVDEMVNSYESEEE